MTHPFSDSDLPLTSSPEEACPIPVCPEPLEADGNRFAASLRALSPEDIPLRADIPTVKRGMDAFTVLRGIALLVCLSVLAYSGSTLIRQVADSADPLYSGLAEGFFKESAVKPTYKDAVPIHSPDYATSQTITDFSEIVKPPVYNEKLEQFKARLGALKEINSEVVGFIHIENTNIEYPLVQHRDNEYYLKHDFTGKYSSRGSIFLDFRNSPTLLENYNTIVYGHHMTTGSDMFKTLDYYFDETFFLNNPDITIYTFDGIYRFRVFSVYITDMNYQYIRTHFNKPSDFVTFCEEMQSRSIFKREGITFDENSHILTLSTCTNIVKTDRISIQALLVDVET